MNDTWKDSSLPYASHKRTQGVGGSDPHWRQENFFRTKNVVQYGRQLLCRQLLFRYCLYRPIGYDTKLKIRRPFAYSSCTTLSISYLNRERWLLKLKTGTLSIFPRWTFSSILISVLLFVVELGYLRDRQRERERERERERQTDRRTDGRTDDWDEQDPLCNQLGRRRDNVTDISKIKAKRAQACAYSAGFSVDIVRNTNLLTYLHPRHEHDRILCWPMFTLCFFRVQNYLLAYSITVRLLFSDQWSRHIPDMLISMHVPWYC